MRWRAANTKAQGSFNGKPATDMLQSYTGATEPSYGKLQLRCEISPQHVPMPANLQFDLECEVAQTLPDGIDLIIGRPHYSAPDSSGQSCLLNHKRLKPSPRLFVRQLWRRRRNSGKFPNSVNSPCPRSMELMSKISSSRT